jgi:hypothetical protein
MGFLKNIRKQVQFKTVASGLPILPNLLRCRALAVSNYSFTLCALHLRQSQQSLNLGQIKKTEILR